MTTFLVRHLNWLLAHPAAGDFAQELAQLTAHARRSAYVQPALRDLGECIHPDCGATLSTAPGRGGGRSREVQCTAGHAWQPHQWLQLFRQIHQSRGHHEQTGAQQAGGST
jgi:hypothetical protein